MIDEQQMVLDDLQKMTKDKEEVQKAINYINNNSKLEDKTEEKMSFLLEVCEPQLRYLSNIYYDKCTSFEDTKNRYEDDSSIFKNETEYKETKVSSIYLNYIFP